MDINNIGKHIRYLRINNKLTQHQLGVILNVSNKTISKWESGTGLPEIESLIN